ncbi:MAG: SDR family NAD(P)-dependent oxidoreductase [Pseudomonadota bacterium]|nr:SDR family NAD(P)-dependent oxidoreductase [Pseudomonadota bacterium]
MAKRHKHWIDADTRAKDVSGKIYIVTGANSGVGLETTRQLVTQGGHVVMACRRPEAGEDVAKSFAGLKGSYEVIRCDLGDLQTVRDFVATFKERHDRLDGLMCNAGAVIMGSEAQYSKDGLELTMAASFDGHFLLTELLLDTLKASAPSRIGILSSVVHAGSPKNRPALNFDDLDWKSRDYSAFAAYAEAKVANVLYAMELDERLKGTGVTTASIHPGWARSNFGSGGPLWMRAVMALARPLTRSMSDSNEESAQTSLHVLLSDDAPNHSGAYFSQSSVLYRDKECRNGGWPLQSPNPNATDMSLAKKLVEVGRTRVGL